MKHAVNVSETEPYVDRYRRRGFVHPFPVLTPEETAYFRAEVETLERRHGGRLAPHDVVQPHLFFPWAYRLATHSKVLDVVEKVLGPDLLVHSCSIFCKYPREPGFIAFHQDGHYWGLKLDRLVSAWIALTESNLANGALQVVPGTHTCRMPHKIAPTEHHLLASGLTLAIPVRQSEAVTLELDPGSMSLHHANIVHGSQPNRSDGKRLGIAIRYVSPSDRQDSPHHEAVLARGEDRHGHYRLLAHRPDGDTEKALEAMVRLRDWIMSHRFKAGGA